VYARDEAMKTRTAGALIGILLVTMFASPLGPRLAEGSRITAKYGAPSATLRRGYLTTMRRDAKIIYDRGQRYYVQDGYLFQPAYRNGRLVYVPVGRL
jgi:hypothetical protein